MTSTTKVKFSFIVEKSYNKTVFAFNFGRHKHVSTLKSDIHRGRKDEVSATFSGR